MFFFFYRRSAKKERRAASFGRKPTTKCSSLVLVFTEFSASGAPQLLAGAADFLSWSARVFEEGGLAPVRAGYSLDYFPLRRSARVPSLISRAIVTAPVSSAPRRLITDHWSWRWIFFYQHLQVVSYLLLTDEPAFSDPPGVHQGRSNPPGKAAGFASILEFFFLWPLDSKKK